MLILFPGPYAIERRPVSKHSSDVYTLTRFIEIDMLAVVLGSLDVEITFKN